jgi:RND family efflux transporter MFP subunit
MMPREWLLPAVLLLGGGWACDTSKNKLAELPPVEVTVMRPVAQEVAQFIEENGTIEPSQEAEVRARVRGFIEKIEFEPGQVVEVGDVLYRIEQDQYEAARKSAASNLAAATAAITMAESLVQTAEAEVSRIEREFQRQQELIQKRVISQAEFDTIAASFASAKANLRSAQASVETAKAEQARADAGLDQAELDFAYTVVRAPIAGRITKTNVKLGNLVDNGTALATVVDKSQVFVNFNVSDREVLRYRENRRMSLPAGEEFRRVDLSTFPVYLRRETDSGFPFEGHLQYADEQGLDSRTGTLAMRALFENPGEELIPGLYVRVRLPLNQQSALLIPELAIGRDQRGSYVLTVDSGGEVLRTPIETSTRYQGWIVVEQGLSPADLVIYEGLQRARPGATVQPQVEQLPVDVETLIRGEIAERGRDASPSSDQPSSANASAAD